MHTDARSPAEGPGALDSSVDEIGRLEADLVARPDDLTVVARLVVRLHAAGRANDARAMEARGLAMAADPAEFHRTVAGLHAAAGEFLAARDAMTAALALRPHQPAWRILLGDILLAGGAADEAVGHYQEALRGRPGTPDAWNNLGTALGILGRHDEAAAAFLAAVRAGARTLAIHDNLARAALHSGRTPAEVCALYESLSRELPTNAIVHARLGRLYEAADRPDDGIRSLTRAASLDRDDLFIRTQLGLALTRQGRLLEASVHLQHALRIAPDDAPTVIHYTNVLRGLGQSARAREVLSAAVARRPEEFRLRASLALALLDTGEPEAAQRELDAIAVDQRDLSDVPWVRALVHERLNEGVQARSDLAALADRSATGAITTFANLAATSEERTEALSRLQEAVARAPADASLRFSLGRMLDRMGDYEGAFRHYAEGNRLAGGLFHPAENRRYFERIMATFTAERIAAWPRPRTSTRRPIFVVGMPRSGTTLVEQILDRHSQIHGAGELVRLPQLVDQLPRVLGTDLSFPETMHRLTPAAVEWLTQSYLLALREAHPDAPYVVDKLPHNFLRLGLIAVAFPEARIVHCVRNRLDTCLSIYFQRFSSQHDYAYDLGNIAHHYRSYVDLMAHWKDAVGLDMVDVHYEDMVSSQEDTTRRLLDHLDLPFEDACLDFHTSGRVVNTASTRQVREPLYRHSIDRWRHYERFLGPLLES